MRHEEYKKTPGAVGTAHFRSTAQAINYYRAYGFSPEDVRAKLSRKEIAIGEPKRVDGSSYAKVWTDTDGRYWIEN